MSVICSLGDLLLAETRRLTVTSVKDILEQCGCGFVKRTRGQLVIRRNVKDTPR